MLLKSYRTEIFRPDCNPQFQSLHCFAHLDQDISGVLPYLNTVLGATGLTLDPPSLMLQVRGQLIAIHPRKIAINALKSVEDAEKILTWLQDQINETWEKRESIEPSWKVEEKPKLIEVLRLLPKTNCRKCRQPTCMVFASLVVQGIKTESDCPELADQPRDALHDYLNRFTFSD